MWKIILWVFLIALTSLGVVPSLRDYRQRFQNLLNMTIDCCCYSNSCCRLLHLFHCIFIWFILIVGELPLWCRGPLREDWQIFVWLPVIFSSCCKPRLRFSSYWGIHGGNRILSFRVWNSLVSLWLQLHLKCIRILQVHYIYLWDG